MSRLTLAVLAVGLVACPPPEKVASSESLTGFWRPHDGEDTIFVFAPASDGEAWFDLTANGVGPQTRPLSAVYQFDSLVQLSTYEATATELKQTVLADQANPPGKQFSTRIYAFERGVKLTLESTKTGGPRDWDGYDFCPRSINYGWGSVPVTPCPNPLTTGGSAAYAPDGTLWVYTGSGRSPGAPTACPEAPAFLQVGPGCRFTQSTAPNGIASALRVFDDGTLRHAYIETSTRELRLRERPPGATDFSETTLRGLNTGTDLTLLEHQAGPLLVTGALTDAGTPLAFQRAGPTWAPVELKPTSDGPPLPGVVAATVDASKRLWLASGKKLWAEGDTSFTPLDVPGDVQAVYVDPEGAPHALFLSPRGLEYGVYRAGAWERHVIDESTSGTIVTQGTRPLRAMVTAPAFGVGSPWRHPALITVADDGHLESELTGGEFNPIPAVSTFFSAVGPRGEIATSLTGEQVMTRSPRGRLYPATKKLEVVVNGPSVRVTTEDGRVSCEGSCSVDVPLGTRLSFKVEPRPGVLVTLPSCDRSSHSKTAPCWLTVVPPMSATTVEQPATFVVQTRSTPLAEVIGAANSQGWATTFGVTGNHVAAAVLFAGNAVEWELDGVAIPVTGSFESVGLVSLDRSSGASVFVALPRGVSIDAVRPDGAGGLFATVFTNNLALTVGNATLGASQQSWLSLLHVTPAGVIDRAVKLHSAPSNQPFASVGTALAADGSAATVVSQSLPLTSLGVSETNALVLVTADGTKSAHGFTSALLSSGDVSMTDAGRVAWASTVGGNTLLWTWTQGQLASTTLAGATLRELHVNADSTLLAVSSAASPLVAGTLSSDGLKHVVRYDATLTPTATYGVPTATANPFSWGVGETSQGVAFISDGEVRWLTSGLAHHKTVALPATAVRVSGVPGLSAQVANDAVWLLSKPDMDFGDVRGSTAIAKLGLF